MDMFWIGIVLSVGVWSILTIESILKIMYRFESF